MFAAFLWLWNTVQACLMICFAFEGVWDKIHWRWCTVQEIVINDGKRRKNTGILVTVELFCVSFQDGIPHTLLSILLSFCLQEKQFHTPIVSLYHFTQKDQRFVLFFLLHLHCIIFSGSEVLSRREFNSIPGEEDQQQKALQKRRMYFTDDDCQVVSLSFPFCSAKMLYPELNKIELKKKKSPISTFTTTSQTRSCRQTEQTSLSRCHCHCLLFMSWRLWYRGKALRLSSYRLSCNVILAKLTMRFLNCLHTQKGLVSEIEVSQLLQVTVIVLFFFLAKKTKRRASAPNTHHCIQTSRLRTQREVFFLFFSQFKTNGRQNRFYEQNSLHPFIYEHLIQLLYEKESRQLSSLFRSQSISKDSSWGFQMLLFTFIRQ